jgi:hypothetical protein
MQKRHLSVTLLMLMQYLEVQIYNNEPVHWLFGVLITLVIAH